MLPLAGSLFGRWEFKSIRNEQSKRTPAAVRAILRLVKVGFVFAINDQIDEHCPQCANDTVYVERLVCLPFDESDVYMCRCGKCGWRFQVKTAEKFVEAPPVG
jgi:DNA-directed RNA polymerase subunit M/transcription elongation factor TFIIS